MGSNKIDRTKLIPSERQRRQAACKSRKMLLEKTLELSKICGKKVRIQVYDQKAQILRIYTGTNGLQQLINHTGELRIEDTSRGHTKKIYFLTNQNYNELRAVKPSSLACICPEGKRAPYQKRQFGEKKKENL